MRRITAKILISVLLTASLLVVPAYADSASVTGDYVNFRNGPGLGYGVIACLRRGTSVTVTGTSGEWSAVIYNGESGYISSQYLSVMPSSVQQGSAPEQAPPATPESEITSPSTQPSSGGNSRTIVVIGDQATTTSGNAITYGSYNPESQAVTSPAPDTPSPSPVQTPSPTPAPAPSSAPSSPAPTSGDTASSSGYINGDYVRFRTGPSTSYTIIGTYSKGKSLTITGTSGDWTKCNIDGKDGFVYTQYVKQGSTTSVVDSSVSASPNPVESKTISATETSSVSSAVTKAGYISGNNVRFRKGPSLDAEIIGEFCYANAVTITGTSGDWTAVSANGKTGYVYSQYVKEGTYQSPASTSSASSSANGQAVVDYAMQYLGYPYKWGGKDPSTGFDCSGFVYYVYSHFGVTLNRIAQDQASNGTHVDSSSLQPGDILCFYSGSNYIGHSGIYIGDGKFIHSATSSTGVIITELSGYYSTRGFEARRILN